MAAAIKERIKCLEGAVNKEKEALKELSVDNEEEISKKDVAMGKTKRMRRDCSKIPKKERNRLRELVVAQARGYFEGDGERKNWRNFDKVVDLAEARDLGNGKWSESKKLYAYYCLSPDVLPVEPFICERINHSKKMRFRYVACSHECEGFGNVVINCCGAQLPTENWELIIANYYRNFVKDQDYTDNDIEEDEEFQ